MYKLLIVEDESGKGKACRAFLNWKDMGVELVGCMQWGRGNKWHRNISLILYLQML